MQTKQHVCIGKGPCSDKVVSLGSEELQYIQLMNGADGYNVFCSVRTII